MSIVHASIYNVREIMSVPLAKIEAKYCLGYYIEGRQPQTTPHEPQHLFCCCRTDRVRL